MAEKADNILKLDLALFNRKEDDVYEALLDWADKIKCLGEAVAELSFRARENGSQVYEWCGEALGNIICDYSRFTAYALENNVLPVLRKERITLNPPKEERLVALR